MVLALGFYSFSPLSSLGNAETDLNYLPTLILVRYSTCRSSFSIRSKSVSSASWNCSTTDWVSTSRNPDAGSAAETTPGGRGRQQYIQ